MSARRKKKPTFHYSGPTSREFWKYINNLPEPDRGEAYAIGCLLQNIEHDALGMIYGWGAVGASWKHLKLKHTAAPSTPRQP